ncbi:MAG: hypothetical protein F6K36_30900 [Symploca sp. SIO3C6]|nr:hypothetical protein [Symploca sp. SIO3C6]
MAKSRITPEQVFHWVEAYINRHQYVPSLREIAAGMGYRSSSPIQRHLQVLRERGWLDWSTQAA